MYKEFYCVKQSYFKPYKTLFLIKTGRWIMSKMLIIVLKLSFFLTFSLSLTHIRVHNPPNIYVYIYIVGCFCY
jgi:hypothetical protein